jgi:four helix bundle protein
MSIQKFEDLFAWQKGQDLSVYVYTTFRNVKDHSFNNQIRRASVSISNNIAEGFDRRSKKEFKQFLYISLASCSEVRSMIYLAERLNYIDLKQKSQLVQNSQEVSKIIRGLINSIQT